MYLVSATSDYQLIRCYRCSHDDSQCWNHWKHAGVDPNLRIRTESSVLYSRRNSYRNWKALLSWRWLLNSDVEYPLYLLEEEIELADVLQWLLSDTKLLSPFLVSSLDDIALNERDDRGRWWRKGKVSWRKREKRREWIGLDTFFIWQSVTDTDLLPWCFLNQPSWLIISILLCSWYSWIVLLYLCLGRDGSIWFWNLKLGFSTRNSDRSSPGYLNDGSWCWKLS